MTTSSAGMCSCCVPIFIYLEKGIIVEENIGKRLVQAMKDPNNLESQESIAKAMELTKAYASSGSATHFSTVTKLFFDLFEMFETGKDPRAK
jgi:hypothetical protein